MNNKKTLLLIEDNHSIRNALIWALNDYNISISIAENGQEALQQLEKSPYPTLIFLDLMLPTLDGFEFRKKKLSKMEWQNIPVIISSAISNLQLVEQNEFEYILPKPFNLDDFYSIINKYF